MIFCLLKPQCSDKWCQSAACKCLREGWLYVAWPMSSEGCLAVTDVILELLWCGDKGCLAANVICGHDIWGLLQVLHSTESGTAVTNVSATLLPRPSKGCLAADMTLNIRGLPVLSQNCFIKTWDVDKIVWITQLILVLRTCSEVFIKLFVMCLEARFLELKSQGWIRFQYNIEMYEIIM